MLGCRAAFVEAPLLDAEAPPVLIELADGTAVRSDDPDANAALTRFFGCAVELVNAAENGYAPR
jgi:hypothetical protein